MIEWIMVSSLIVVGLLLIIAEIIFIPGTTIVGILGLIFLIAGIAMSFSYFGEQTGWVVLGGTGVFSGLILYYAFKANVWGAFSLKGSSDSHVNEGALEGIDVGQEGRALSALRPMGTAEVGNKTYEVKTMGDFVAAGTRIRIIKVVLNQIIVEPIA